jgi:uncharacterized protein (TIGR03435 family)
MLTRVMSKLLPGCVLFVLQIAAQTSPSPAFEVASVKPSQPGQRGSSVTHNGGGLRSENATVKALIGAAYRVQPFQIAGGPSWTTSEGFDINARASSAVSGSASLLMLRTLLAERFKLRFHSENKELPAYRLVAAKGGPKMPASAPGLCPGTPDRDHPCGGFRLSNRSHLYGERVEVADLAEELQFALGRAIFDRSSLTGYYTIKLDWTPDDTLFPGFGNERPDAPKGDLDGASLFTAMQEQLGLRLEGFKGPVPILVIDSVERPAAN